MSATAICIVSFLAMMGEEPKWYKLGQPAIGSDGSVITEIVHDRRFGYLLSTDHTDGRALRVNPYHVVVEVRAPCREVI